MPPQSLEVSEVFQVHEFKKMYAIDTLQFVALRFRYLHSTFKFLLHMMDIVLNRKKQISFYILFRILRPDSLNEITFLVLSPHIELH